jgi:hypothetical protein
VRSFALSLAFPPNAGRKSKWQADLSSPISGIDGYIAFDRDLAADPVVAFDLVAVAQELFEIVFFTEVPISFNDFNPALGANPVAAAGRSDRDSLSEQCLHQVRSGGNFDLGAWFAEAD